MNSPAKIVSISELNRLARNALERELPLLWVAGEISNLTRAASGHLYFNLKDETAQARCVMFRARAGLVPWALANGQQVEARALVSLYEPRGEYQLNIESLRRAGLGKLYEAFSRLKQLLETEGLFAAEIKQPLPRFPRSIGIVTSLQAAALHDVLTALARRAAHVPVVIYPTTVQGEAAPAQIIAAINDAVTHARCQVLLIVRGGGSIEDLWAFNDEAVARAIAACSIPTIVGVGHETDSTIADFVADVRAATPTAAAEMVSEAWYSAARHIESLGASLQRAMRRKLDLQSQRIDSAARRLLHPSTRMQRVQNTLAMLRHRMIVSVRQQIRDHRANVTRLATALTHLNPEAILHRGYAIVMESTSREIVTNASQISPGNRIELRFANGSAEAQIESISDHSASKPASA